jgi:hypothetical protein
MKAYYTDIRLHIQNRPGGGGVVGQGAEGMDLLMAGPGLAALANS